jgi:hypothetical protein
MLQRPTHFPALLALLAALAACGEVSSDVNANPPPTLTAIEPASGGVPGGTLIQLTGSGFTENDPGENRVFVGGVAGTNVTATDDSTLTFNAPEGDTPNVAVDVLVSNANGFAELPTAFTYNPLPTVTGVAPALAAPGATVTVTGSGFTDPSTSNTIVFFGRSEATDVMVLGDGELTAVVPDRGDADFFAPVYVAVATANGSATLFDAFRFAKPGILLVTNGRDTVPAVYFLDLDVDPYQVIRLAQLDERVSGMALSPDGIVYVATNAINTTNRLGRLDPGTGHIDYIGPLRVGPGVFDRVKELAFVGDTAYVFLRDAARLATVNLTTGQYILVGDPPVAPLDGAIGITRRDADSMFLLTALNQPLRFVETATSLITDGPVLDSTSTAQVHAVLATETGLLAVTRQNAVTGDGLVPSLVRIDPVSGEVTVLGIAPAGTSAMIPTPPSFGP